MSHQRRGSGVASHASVTPGGQCQDQCVTPPLGSVFASQHIMDRTAVCAVQVRFKFNGQIYQK